MEVTNQKAVVGRSDSGKFWIICWSLVLIISSLFTQSQAQNIEGVTLVETNNGNIRINNNIQFTCTFRFRAGTSGSVAAVNLEYSDENKVCISLQAGKSVELKNDCIGREATILPSSITSGTQYIFTIKNAKLSDQRQFFCKVYETFSDTSQSPKLQVTVLVPPLEPVITLSDTGTLVAGEPLTITCVGNTGKPEGNLLWFRTASSPGATEVAINADTSQKNPQANGTMVIRETIPRIEQLQITHNGVKFRCAGTNTALLQNEEKPSAEITLNVLYAVTAVTVTPSSVGGKTSDDVPYLYADTNAKITCSANGNPAPTLSWTKVSGPSDLTSLSDTLFVGSATTLGVYEYRCTARNTVEGSTKEVTKDYKFAVEAKPTDPPTTPKPTNPTKTEGPNTGTSTGGLNTAGLAGGLAGAIIAILIIVAIVFCVCRRKKKGMLDEDTEKGKQNKGQGFDNGPMGGFDVELDDNQHYGGYSKHPNGGAFPIDTVDNTPGSRRGFHVPGDNFEPAYM